ncbi:MAG: MgtC/SapB family protein [Opitutaceae bacterium]|nr:MgtC/SapB family protein [Cytophagales bacterium]
MWEEYIGYIPDSQELIKLLLSIVIGGIIGAEREYRSKSAGFRTLILICVGSTLFTIFSIELGGKDSPDRMAANIVTGIGFLGAGAIFRDVNNITKGLTTATIIWITAALGVGIGVGHFILITLATALLLVILTGFPYLEMMIDKKHQIRNYRLYLQHKDQISDIEMLFKTCKLKAARIKHIRKEGKIISNWEAGGSEKNHSEFINQLFLKHELADFEF